MRDFPVTMDEVKALMKKEENKRYSLIIAAVGVIALLVGLILWIAKKREKDLEEHYEYFDDDFDELDENYEDFDESIYDDDDDSEEQIEYVKIKDFINEEDDEANSACAEDKKEVENKKEEVEAKQAVDEKVAPQ